MSTTKISSVAARSVSPLGQPSSMGGSLSNPRRFTTLADGIALARDVNSSNRAALPALLAELELYAGSCLPPFAAAPIVVKLQATKGSMDDGVGAVDWQLRQIGKRLAGPGDSRFQLQEKPEPSVAGAGDSGWSRFDVFAWTRWLIQWSSRQSRWLFVREEKSSSLGGNSSKAR